MSKDLKTSKKRCGELSSEVAQANMRIRGLHEELKSEKDKNKLSAEHVAMLKDSLEEKQTSVVELKRMVCSYDVLMIMTTLLIQWWTIIPESMLASDHHDHACTY